MSCGSPILNQASWRLFFAGKLKAAQADSSELLDRAHAEIERYFDIEHRKQLDRQQRHVDFAMLAQQCAAHAAFQHNRSDLPAAFASSTLSGAGQGQKCSASKAVTAVKLIHAAELDGEGSPRISTTISPDLHRSAKSSPGEQDATLPVPDELLSNSMRQPWQVEGPPPHVASMPASSLAEIRQPSQSSIEQLSVQLKQADTPHCAAVTSCAQSPSNGQAALEGADQCSTGSVTVSPFEPVTSLGGTSEDTPVAVDATAVPPGHIGPLKSCRSSSGVASFPLQGTALVSDETQEGPEDSTGDANTDQVGLLSPCTCLHLACNAEHF